MSDARLTDVTVVPAEGARIGLVSCRLCGATLMLDPRDDIDTSEIHMDWHRHHGDTE